MSPRDTTGSFIPEFLTLYQYFHGSEQKTSADEHNIFFPSHHGSVIFGTEVVSRQN